jgi:predicted transcriptional regulator
MMMSAKPMNGGGAFGPLEAEVMDAVWAAAAPVSVREVMRRLNDGRTEPLAYTTVMTVMSRLAEKKALARSPVGRSYVYEASATDRAGIAVKNVIRTYGDEAMAHFVDQARGDPELLRRMEQLLREQ